MIDNEHINRAIDYILNHINEDISVDDIALHCNFSRYHFSRMFKAQTGESVYEFIKRKKLEQSAFRLKVEKSRSITDVGLEYGYSPSNYSSAFKQQHELSPVKFRRSIWEKSLVNPIFSDADVKLQSFEEINQKISIEIIPDFSVIYERYKGNYFELSEHWCEFEEKYSEYINEQTILIERTYDDPSITDIDECLYDICMTVSDDIQLPNTYIITGGKFAIYHFKDSVKQIYTTYQSIFNIWLPQSKYEIDERYNLEIYRHIDCNAMIMEIDICIPIK